MLNAIVLAAGKGTRMHSNKAKTMHKILDKPILEHVYDTLDKLQCKNRMFQNVKTCNRNILNYN